MRDQAALIASFLIGAVAGLICVAIFRVILSELSKKRPKDAIKLLRALLGTVLGGGLVDYAAFREMRSTGTLSLYLIGLALVFLPLGIAAFLEWRRAQPVPVAAKRIPLSDEGERTLSK